MVICTRYTLNTKLGTRLTILFRLLPSSGVGGLDVDGGGDVRERAQADRDERPAPPLA
jgi:hypothetical protein